LEEDVANFKNVGCLPSEEINNRTNALNLNSSNFILVEKYEMRLNTAIVSINRLQGVINSTLGGERCTLNLEIMQN